MAVYNQTLVTPDALYNQTKSYDARSDRKWFSDFSTPGVVGTGDFAVTYSGTLLQLSVAAGAAWILGGNISDQGTYRQYVSTTTTVTCPAASGTNPRIDTVILRVMDNAADASGFNESRVEVVPGTATSGANLTNLSGKDPLTSLGEASKSFIVLAYILVPQSATTLTNTATNVKDARSFFGIPAAKVSGLSFIPARHSCRAKQSTPQSIAADTATVVTLDGEDWDSDGYHDNVTSNSRVTVPTGLGGIVMIVGMCVFPNPSEAGIWGAIIRKNGTTYMAANSGDYVSTDSFRRYPSANIIDLAAPTDYYELMAHQTHSPSGGAATLVAATLSIALISL